MDFKTFNKQVFKGFNVSITNNTVTMELDLQRLVKFSLIYTGVVGQYDTYSVEIINKCTGLIDKQNFGFYGFFSKKDELKPTTNDNPKFYAKYSSNGIEWFNEPKPAAMKKFIEQIMEYIEMFNNVEIIKQLKKGKKEFKVVKESSFYRLLVFENGKIIKTHEYANVQLALNDYSNYTK